MECKENMQYLYKRVNSSLQPLGITQLFLQPTTNASFFGYLGNTNINHGLHANIAETTTESLIRGVHFTDANNLCRCTACLKLCGAGVPIYSKQNVIG